MRKLVVLAGLAMAFAVALPGSTEATSLTEVKKLLATDAQAGAEFGISVAVSGDTAVVGAHFDDAEGAFAGTAYVFQRNEIGADNWGEVNKLTASDAAAGDFFGRSVAVSGDTAVVGASWEDAGGIGFRTGAAYVFRRNEGGADNWGEVKKLTASDAQAGDEFGSSVAVSGDTAVVGAWHEGGAGGFGAAYVFQRNEGGSDNWGEVTKLTGSHRKASHFFGYSVAVSGGVIVVGERPDVSMVLYTDAAYIFERNEGGTDNWGEVKRLTASDAGIFERFAFGRSVAVSGGTVVVGAYVKDAGSFRAGAAYVYQRDQGGADNWGEVTKLTASDARVRDRFGFSVAVSGDSVVIGRNNEGIGGDLVGAAYVYQRDEGGAGNWGEVTKLTASDVGSRDRFGSSVAVSGDTAVVGAYYEDAGGPDAGAAYVFDLLLPKPTPTPCSPEGCPTATSTPTPAPLPGDVNCDSTVTSIDAALILQLSAGLLGPLPCAGVADVNHDGSINSIDAALILQFTAGLLDSLSPP